MKKCLVLFLIVVVCLSMTGCLSRFSFYLDDLSTDEVGSLLEKYLTTLPEAGSMPDEFATLFKSKPISFDFGANSYDFLSFKFFKEEKEIPSKDALTNVTLFGVYSQMDGSMGLNENITVCTDSVIYDYDRATELYDRLFNYLKPFYDNVEDSREKTEWTSRGLFYTTDINHVGTPGTMVSLKKMSNYYELKAFYRVCILNDQITMN